MTPQPPELQGAHRRSAGSAVPVPRSACFALAKGPQKRPKRGSRNAPIMGKMLVYPLVMTNIAIENDHL